MLDHNSAVDEECTGSYQLWQAQQMFICTYRTDVRKCFHRYV